MSWFRTHPAASLLIVWLGGGGLLAGLVIAILRMETYQGELTIAGMWIIILLCVGYSATLLKVCQWVLEEKAQDRNLLWFFPLTLGILPVIVALLGKDNTVMIRIDTADRKAETAIDLEVRTTVEREKGQPLITNRISGRAKQLADGHFNRALEYENLGDYNNAIQEYSRAIDLNSNYEVAYFNRGALFLQQGKKVRARADFLKVTSLSEDSEISEKARRALDDLESQ